MSAKLKPCPFCGKEPRIVIGKYATCETEGCPTEAIAAPLKKWNLRKPEIALQKRIAELETFISENCCIECDVHAVFEEECHKCKVYKVLKGGNHE